MGVVPTEGNEPIWISGFIRTNFIAFYGKVFQIIPNTNLGDV
jgi:hypothetical protein